MQRPETGDYNPYFQKYLDLTGQADFSELYIANTAAVEDFFSDIPETLHDYAYESGKWTVKQVLQHIIDTERVMAYRALVIARADDATKLFSMDQDLYADNADLTLRNMDGLIAEWLSLRNANRFMFESFSREQTLRKQLVFDHLTTPAALGYIIIGHANHHVRIINERYLS